MSLPFAIELSFNQALGPLFIRPNLNNPQSHRLQQLVPFPFRSLMRGRQSHHDPVSRRYGPCCFHVWYDVLIDEDLGVASLHGGNKLSKDLTRVLVSPVMEHGVQVIRFRSCFLLADAEPE